MMDGADPTGIPAVLAEMLRALESSGPAELVRLTPHLYPVLMSLHVLGIALLVGPVVALDLRLLGLGRSVVPVTLAAHHLLPLCRVGFAMVAATGAMMFAAVALTAGTSAAAPWKLALILAAAANIVVFHRGVFRTVADWDLGRPSPLAARLAALVSILSWTGAIFAGRFLAY